MSQNPYQEDAKLLRGATTAWDRQEYLVLMAQSRAYAEGRDASNDKLTADRDALLKAVKIARRRFTMMNNFVSEQVWNDNYEAVKALDDVLHTERGGGVVE